MEQFFRTLKYTPFIFYIVIKRLYRENYTYHASALAFITLLSFVPIISITIYFFSFFTIFTDFIGLSENYIYANFVPEISNPVRAYLNKFTHQANQLPAISILFSIVTGIMMVLTIEKAFEDIWNEKPNPKSLLAMLVSWSILLFIALFLGFIASVSISISSLLWLHQFQYVVLNLLNFALNIFLFAVFYIVIPNKPVSWIDGLVAGLIVAIFFEIGKKLFVLYIVYLTSYEYIYGALAVFPIFILWIYVAWLIILFGALFIHEKNRIVG